MNMLMLLAVMLGGMGPVARSGSAGDVDLRPETTAAFQAYVQKVEAQIDERVSGKKNFLWLDDSPARRARVQGGEAVIERMAGTKPVGVPDGLIHDFIGAVFIKGATLAQTIAFVQDYNRHKDFYGPEVVDSRIESRDGEHFVIYMRLKKHKVITVVLDTWHDARFFQLDTTRWYSQSRTTKVVDVDNPGTSEERTRPAGTGGGFMWNLNSYWRFAERDGGVYVECQAVSLSRSIPMWAKVVTLGGISPIVNDLPRESLANTLTATRNGVAKVAARPRQ